MPISLLSSTTKSVWLIDLSIRTIQLYLLIDQQEGIVFNALSDLRVKLLIALDIARGIINQTCLNINWIITD
jgi:hypothetical protein